MKNHKYSEASKAPGQCPAKVEVCAKGNIVHVKSDLSKHHARHFYLVASVDYKTKSAKIQKFCCDQLRQKYYVVNLDEIYMASPHVTSPKPISNNDEGISLHRDKKEHNGMILPPIDSVLPEQPTRSSTRVRNPPNWLATEEIERS